MYDIHMAYIRRNFYIGIQQNNFLESQKDLSVSEHIRRAIDQYIEKLTLQKTSASASKKGGQNGTNNTAGNPST